jgi:uncharacterized alpha-E superfamily protein
MISRVADHCFWFGRYVERAESTARLLAATLSLALDAELEAAHCWRPVIVVAGEEAGFRARCAEGRDDHRAWGDGELVQRFMTWDEDNLVSLRRSISGARWNARQIREVVSLEAWEAVNELHLWMSGHAATADWQGQRDTFYRHVRKMTQLCLGLLRSTMLHDEPLDFIWLGVLLERVSQTARTLDVHHHAFTQLPHRHDIIETAMWLSLLRSLSGSEPFMKRNQGKVTTAAVARFLVDEPQFPRSIAYCVHSAHDRLSAIRPPEHTELPGAKAAARLAALDAWLAARRTGAKDAIERSEIGEVGTPTASPAGRGSSPVGSIHEVLTHVVDQSHAVCDELAEELLG